MVLKFGVTERSLARTRSYLDHPRGILEEKKMPGLLYTENRMLDRRWDVGQAEPGAPLDRRALGEGRALGTYTTTWRSTKTPLFEMGIFHRIKIR